MSAYRNWKLDISLDDTNRAPALDDLVHALLSYLSTIRGHNLKTLHIKLTAHAHAYDGANLPSSAFDTMEGCLSRLVYDLRGLHNLTEVENKTVEIDFGKLGRSSWLWYHPVFQNQTVVMDMSGNVGRVVSTQKTDRPIHISSTCEGCKPAQRAASVISGLDPEEAMEMFSFALDSDTFSSELGTKSILKTVFPEVALAKDEQGWLWLYYQSSVEDSRFTGQGVKLT
ncbi:hypothetical protein K490DRAFT_61846 [Saccharata proteae CBS 121410]|uniref:Uncharacterized protein n=1 Tax=Saccharata proteae CBS 121410 TaxID=1314787 RepID=A0A9P4HZ28_9PEZI|nr:hypothetical protein K490DRAFT_61846 [Saccharata proteae CBS 121410]